MKTQIIGINEEDAVEIGAGTLKSGKIIAFPTDTVYGVASSAFDKVGVDKLFEIKNREHLKAIAVLIASIEQLSLLVTTVPEFAQELAGRFWPGPLTLVLPALPSLPKNLSPFPTIGIRMPDHKFVRNLILKTGPLATTSANLSGKQNTTSAQEVLAQLAGRVDIIFDGGKTRGPVPSTVIDCAGENALILREGVLSFNVLHSVIGDKLKKPTS